MSGAESGSGWSVPRQRFLVTGRSGFIGSNLVEALRRLGSVDVVNVDIAAPRASDQVPCWVEGDVRDAQRVKDVFTEFEPTHVVHLAARIDMGGASLADYSVNTEGTSNIVDAVANTSSLQRTLFISSQFVCQPGYLPRSDEDYMPHTIYGRSKVEAEQMVRKADLRSEWVILRPTTVWGPGDIYYRRDFYRTIKRGIYLHPRGKTCLRSYGFVGNVVSQICFFLNADAESVNRGTFYVGDPVADIVEFAHEFSRQLRGRSARMVPASLVHGIAIVGDIATRVGIGFPLTTSRYASMTEGYPVPIERTIALTGTGPYSLQEGVRQTVAWLEAHEATHSEERPVE
jgi:nucleoside-diphosphate-sugar epimerase